MDATGENLAKSVAPATSIAEQATPINQQPSKASSEAEIKGMFSISSFLLLLICGKSNAFWEMQSFSRFR